MSNKECPIGGCDAKSFEEKFGVKLITAKLRLDQSLQCPKCKWWNPLGSTICSECGETIQGFEFNVGDATRARNRKEKNAECKQ